MIRETAASSRDANQPSAKYGASSHHLVDAPACRRVRHPTGAAVALIRCLSFDAPSRAPFAGHDIKHSSGYAIKMEIGASNVSAPPSANAEATLSGTTKNTQKRPRGYRGLETVCSSH